MDEEVFGLSIQLDPTGPTKEVKGVTVILLNSSEERNSLYVKIINIEEYNQFTKSLYIVSKF